MKAGPAFARDHPCVRVHTQCASLFFNCYSFIYLFTYYFFLSVLFFISLFFFYCSSFLFILAGCPLCRRDLAISMIWQELV